MGTLTRIGAHRGSLTTAWRRHSAKRRSCRGTSFAAGGCAAEITDYGGTGGWNARRWLAVTAGALFATGTAGSAIADQGNDQAKKENLSTQVAKKGNPDITINFEFDSSAPMATPRVDSTSW
jgi:hypothetical protein